MATMNSVNISSETLLYNSSLLEDELDALEEQLRVLQAQADQDALLIDDVSLKYSLLCNFVVVALCFKVTYIANGNHRAKHATSIKYYYYYYYFY